MKYASYIFIGVLNVIHALSHLLQFIQSMLLISVSTHKHHDTWIETMLHNPYTNILWLVIGITSLYLGIKDYRHHKKHKCGHTHD